MDALAGDVFGDKRENLHVCCGAADFVLDVCFAWVEPTCEATADFYGFILIFDKLHPAEHDNAPEGIRPAAFIFHALVDDRERCARVLLERIDLVSLLCALAPFL